MGPGPLDERRRIQNKVRIAPHVNSGQLKRDLTILVWNCVTLRSQKIDGRKTRLDQQRNRSTPQRHCRCSKNHYNNMVHTMWMWL